MTKTAPAPVKTPTATPVSTKDNGTVHVGGGAMRFATTVDAGTVHIGGGAMRFARTSDAGQVHIGGGAMRF